MPLHPIDVYVGKRIRLRRTLLGVTQETIAKALGITFQQVQKYERGVNRLGASRLYETARALSVEVAYFYEGLEAPTVGVFSPAKDTEKTDSREMLELARSYYGISKETVRKRVFELVKALAAKD